MQENILSDFKDSQNIAYDAMEYIKEMRASGNFLLDDFGSYTIIDLLNTINHIINRDKGIVYFLSEMPAKELMIRLLSIQTSIPIKRLCVGNVNDKEWKSLVESIDKMNSARFFVYEQSDINISQLRSKLKKIKDKYPEIEFIVFDKIQVLQETTNQNINMQISDICLELNVQLLNTC